jgi:gliding motility-associated-like protein
VRDTFVSCSTGGGPLHYAWDLGTGRYSDSTTSPSRTFTAGTYSIGLIVWNDNGCRDTIRYTNYISVTSRPTASFTYTVTNGCGQSVITATATSAGTGYSWTPAGGTSAGNTYTYPVTSTGTIRLCLNETFTGGCADDTCRNVSVTVTPTPHANYTFTCLQSCKSPFTVTYTSTGTGSGGAHPHSWTFPGGTPSTGTGAGPITVTYTAPPGGATFPMPVLTDSNASRCQDIFVSPGIVQISPMHANFVLDSLNKGCKPLRVGFHDLSSVNSCDSVTHWNWSFGPGLGTDTTRNPIFAFPDTGCFAVKLIATSATGCTDTINMLNRVCVGDTPVFTLIQGPDTMCFEAGFVSFNALGNEDSCFWHFADGLTGRGDTISHIYEDTGIFVPYVECWYHGCGPRKTFGDTILIMSPVAKFRDSTFCGDRYRRFFINTSIGADSSYWEFGDTTTLLDTATTRNANWRYPGPGCYNVTLTVWNFGTGCMHFVTHQVCICLVVPDFVASTRDTCSNSRISLTNTSNCTRAGNSTYFYPFRSWQPIGPGTQTFTYNVECYQTVRMVNIDPSGCRDTVTKPNYIRLRNISPRMGVPIKAGCVPFNCQFYDSSRVACTSLIRYKWDFGETSRTDDTSALANPVWTYTRAGTYLVTLSTWDSTGCRFNTAPFTVRAFGPQVTLTCDSFICINNLLPITASVVDGYTPTYRWNAPGATPSSATTLTIAPLHFDSIGAHQISFIVTDTLGCADTAVKNIFAYQPTANFSASDTFFICHGNLINFFDSSTYNVCSVSWDFGDGTGSTLRNPSHIYTVPGVYSVTLIMTTCDGCVDTLVRPTFIHIKGPSGSFTFAPDQICVGHEVDFHITSQNTYLMQLVCDDGAVIPLYHTGGIIENVDYFDTIVHIYADTGVYYPQLLLTDSSGCQIPINPRLPITVDSLWVKFGLVKTHLCDSATVCFYDSSVYMIHHTIPNTWTWDFGDGSPVSHSRKPFHFYSRPGTYKVTLSAQSVGSCLDSNSVIVKIPRRPHAAFLTSDTLQCVSEPAVVFTDQSTGDTTISRWTWSFRPLGVTFTTPNVTYDFTGAGTYTAQLIIRDTVGCSDTTSRPITIIANPRGNAGRDTTICYGDSARLSGGGGISYLWTPNINISNPTISNPYVFPDSNQIYILQANDSAGCAAFDTVLISVSRVIASFRMDSVCFRDTTHFVDLSSSNTGSVVRWSWNFGDPTSGSANTSSSRNPAHVFTSSTAFNVLLTATNNIGCHDDTIVAVPVSTSPFTNFRAPSVCYGDTMHFTDISTIAVGAISVWNWDFGVTGITTDVSTLQNPTYVYTSPGVYNVRLSAGNLGCGRDTVIQVRVWAKPVANFRNDTTCITNPTSFIDISTDSFTINSWQWDFDTAVVAGDTATTQNFTYTAPYTGTAYTHLTISDIHGCSDDTIRPTVIVNLPVASFRGDTICPGDTMYFTDASFVPGRFVSRRHWDFGDASTTIDTSNAASTFYSFALPGTYNVRLTVWDRYGCTDDTTISVLVVQGPLPNFSADSVCFGDTTHFYDSTTLATGTIVSWNWDFGDPVARFSTLQNPTHVFSTAGNQRVKLTVTSSNGCVNTITKTVRVFFLPVANFIADSVCLHDTTHFSSNSIAGSNPILSYTWGFNPGDSSNALNPSYYYPDVLPHTVYLNIVDSRGCHDDTAMNIQIFTLPVANFTHSPGCQNLDVAFTDLSINGSGIINRWDWNFGEALPSLSTLQNPIHVYADTAYHNVRLQVTDSRGCKDDTIIPMRINPVPLARFGVAPSIAVCLGSPICFHDSSTGPIASINSWIWDFNGDLTPDITGNANPCYTYPAAGNYIVTLTVTDTNGCYDTSRVRVTVNQPPIAAFTADTSCQHDPLHFTDQSTAGSGIVNAWAWNFGDLSGDNVRNPTHIYPFHGSYPVTLIITDANGCKDTATNTVYVDSIIHIQAYSDTSVCLGNSVHLSAGGGFSYLWTPPNFLNRTDTSDVICTPTSSVSYTVTAFSQFKACPSSSQTIVVQVLPPMPFDVEAEPTTVVLGTSSQLTGYPAGRIDSIRWWPGATLNCTDCIDPRAQPDQTTTYYARIYYSLIDAYCETDDSVTINVLNQCPKDIVYIPNTFTPNADGQNDAFYVRGYGLDQVKVFRVFDRWGDLLFERTDVQANDKNNAWNGNNRKGQAVNPGVYVYYVEVYCSNHDLLTITGNVTLIR